MRGISWLFIPAAIGMLFLYKANRLYEEMRDLLKAEGDPFYVLSFLKKSFIILVPLMFNVCNVYGV
jgi:hypothetical protein